MITIYSNPKSVDIYAVVDGLYLKRQLKPIGQIFCACFDLPFSTSFESVTEKQIELIVSGFKQTQNAMDEKLCLDEWGIQADWTPVLDLRGNNLPVGSEVYIYNNGGRLYWTSVSTSNFFADLLEDVGIKHSDFWFAIPAQFVKEVSSFLKKTDVEICLVKGMVYLRSDAEMIKFPSLNIVPKNLEIFNSFISPLDKDNPDNKFVVNENFLDFLLACKSQKLTTIYVDGDKLKGTDDGSKTIETKKPEWFKRDKIIVPAIKGSSNSSLNLNAKVLVLKLKNGNYTNASVYNV